MEEKLLLNRLTLLLKQQTTLFYRQVGHCNNSTCKNESEAYRLDAPLCQEHCGGKVRLSFNQNRLYTLLVSLKRLFDPSRYANNENYKHLLKKPALTNLFGVATAQVDSLLSQYMVDLPSTFSFLA